MKIVRRQTAADGTGRMSVEAMEVFTKEFKKYAGTDNKMSAEEWSKYESKWLTDDEREHTYMSKHVTFDANFPKCNSEKLSSCKDTLDLDAFLKVKFALGTHRNEEWFYHRLEL